MGEKKDGGGGVFNSTRFSKQAGVGSCYGLFWREINTVDLK